MAVYLLCATPLADRVRPIVRIGADLSRHGHRVVVLTGSRFAGAAVASGLEHVALPSGRDRSAQTRAMADLVSALAPAGIVADSSFARVLSVPAGDDPRPPVLGIRPAHSGPPAGLDADERFDRMLSLSWPELDGTGDAPSSRVRIVGPLPVPPASGEVRADPGWWDDLFDGRPVLHVAREATDPYHSRLTETTVDAVRGMDAVLVVGAARGALAFAGRLPENVRVADAAAFDRLLPVVDLVVSGGGRDSVRAALQRGVPLVVAGGDRAGSEEAGRVARVGAGIDLRTGAPSAGRVRDAIAAVITEPHYLQSAQSMARSARSYDALAAIRAELLAASLAAHPRR